MPHISRLQQSTVPTGNFRLVWYRGAYYAAWREQGIQRRKALRTKHRDIAEQTLKSFIEQYDIANRPSPVTVEYIWNGYRETLRGKPAWTTMGFEERAVLRELGTCGAAGISERDCRRYYVSRRTSGRRDGTIRTELSRLRSALIWAERKNLISKAPAIWLPPMPVPRDLRLTREEAARFLSACVIPHVKLFVILAMMTGARSGALLQLTWARVDFDGRLIDLHDPASQRTKKGRAIVPINRTAIAALTEARTGALTPYVIEWAGKPVMSVKKALKAAGRRCGMPWVTAHVFRHSAACWMAEAGIGMAEIAQFLGHSDSRTTERTYARFSPDYLRKAAEALEIGGMSDVKGKTG
jgi:integrase